MPAICGKVVYISNTHQRSKVTEAISVSNVTSRFAQFWPLGFNAFEDQKRFVMRHITIFLIALGLTACGPSQEEIDNAATITCNIMSESSNMDAGTRIKEVNATREKIGAPPYLGTDATIRESLDWDLCEELIKNNANYPDLVVVKKEAEARRLEEERLKQARAKAEAEEAERVARADGERKYREIVSDYIAEFPSRPKLLNVEYSGRTQTVKVEIECIEQHKTLYYDLKLEFDGGSLAEKSLRFSTGEPQECRTFIETEDAFFIENKDLMSKLRYAELEIKHILRLSEAVDREERIRLHPGTYGVSYYVGLENGIIWVLFDESTK